MMGLGPSAGMMGKIFGGAKAKTAAGIGKPRPDGTPMQSKPPAKKKGLFGKIGGAFKAAAKAPHKATMKVAKKMTPGI
jgi:hypothetical protein